MHPSDMCIINLHLFWFSLKTYIGCWSLVVLGDAALQVERQVVATDQDSLAKLLFKVTHIWLNSRQV